MKNCLATALVLMTFASGSHAADNIDIATTGPVVLKALPSGSGMTWHAGKYFVVGDDSPYLFTLNRKFAIVDKTLLQDHPLKKNGRIAKKIKPDHEAMATVAWNGAVWNLILGSGSKKGTRESGLLVAVNDKSVSHVRDMAGLYREFAALAGFEAGQTVNIEGVAVARDAVYFFNRGNAGQNLLFKVALADLMAYMTGQANRIADIRRYVVKLPRLEGREAGLSGADHWPEIDSLVYSASVEGTDNAYDDGAVLGSFLGLIPLSELEDGAPIDLTRSAQRLLSKGGVPLKTKVESIALTHTGPRQATAALVSDNDDGTSEFFDVVLSLKAAPRR
jgi:hypothetical protein